MRKLVARALVSLVWIGLAAAEEPQPAPRAIEDIVVTAQDRKSVV